MSYRRLLIGVRVLGNRFAGMGAPGDTVGVLLPNAAPVATAFFALQSAAQVAAMLNYTAGPANLASAVRTGSIRRVVSSRAFIEKAQLADEVAAIEAAGARVVWLEDLRDSVTTLEKLAGALFHRRPLARTKADDAAVMLFTSGSEGPPKGVMLSHRNLLANVAQVETRIAFSPADSLLNVLPTFHSFGLMGGMILPLLSGVRLVLYPSPLHYKAVPEMAASRRPTALFGTDTFLAAYARAADDDDFASLRLVVAGAEPVRAETRRVWRERFGVDIREGYGMTEASPVVAVNSATHAREGTVGRLVPALRARLEPVEGVADGGRLFIAGPNVMLGYLSEEKPGELLPPPGGWHDTGDIVVFDREGFVRIQGRAKRFAKIAGEMVSLSASEMLAQTLWPEAKHAAVALPDERKGERVVLVTTAAEASRNELRAQARKNGVADIAMPAEIVQVKEIPVLGTGKTDFAAVRKLAENGTDGVGEAA
jgi:acyl-[acyl-carrier-protein]-phospholipid O-acyltransferase/long-chain-fatty-acid--[acyl-carrier-protein] ligase